MSEIKMNRRQFIKALGAAGVATTFLSQGTAQPALAQAPAIESPAPEFVANLTGANYGKAVALATGGVGFDKNWKAGDALKYLPKEELIGGKYADAFKKLPKEKMLDMLKKMQLIRKWETMGKDLFLSGKEALYGVFHMYIGEEATAVGVCAALNKDDYIASTHRGHGHIIAKEVDLKRSAAEIYASSEGTNKGYGQSMHIIDMSKGIMGTNGIVGGAWLLAQGAGYAAKIHGKKQVSVGFGGDNACHSPYFFNAIRNAVAYNIPYIAVIENNFYGSGGINALVSAVKYQAELAKGLNIPCLTVDGNDVIAMYSATLEAVQRAREKSTPTVIEAITYRWYDHNGFAGAKAGVDGAFGLPYRTDAEVRGWMTRDPIVRYSKWLVANKIATEDELKALDAAVTKEVTEAWAWGKAAPKCKPEQGLENVWVYGKVEATQFLDRKGTSVAWEAPDYIKKLSKTLVLEA